MPLLLVCEDNGIGISTPTPEGWIAANFSNKPGLRYFACDGLDLADALTVAQKAGHYVRKHRKPAFLHVRTVRLYGHAGSDVEASYRRAEAIASDQANDPLLHSVRLLTERGVCTADEALRIYQDTAESCERLANLAMTRPRLKTHKEVGASLVPPSRPPSHSNGSSTEARTALFGSDLKAMQEPQPMSRLISWALADLMLEGRDVIIAGEDVGRKGGVYGATQKLQARFGPDRVIDTLLDEQSILGLSIGLAHNGFVPVPEIQFLAYLHNAEDQLRGEAATLSFFSNGQYSNPMVVRIAGLGYQRGFGGHFHNDNSLAVLRDIPGIIIACPSNGADAAMMLREAVRLARDERRVVVFVEPIALYPMRDFLEDGDRGWMQRYPSTERRIALGEVAVHGQGTDIAIVTYGNGCYLSRRAMAALETQGIATRVIDMRWLAPQPDDALLRETSGCGTVLIVDECRRTGSQSEALMTLFAEAGRTDIARITAEDCFIATGPAFAATLPSVEGIVEAAQQLAGRKR